MRIVGGIYGGRRLIVPKNRDIRPTSDKVRGAVFNMLESRSAVEGAHVLDAFCGSGALGLEALSRGASRCTFFDKARTSLDLAKDNAENLQADGDCIFKLQDCLKLSKRTSQDTYSLVFLDPPYSYGMVSDALLILSRHGWLSSDSFVVCEMEREAGSLVSEGFSMEVEKTYGDIVVQILRYHAGIEHDEQGATQNDAIDGKGSEC